VVVAGGGLAGIAAALAAADGGAEVVLLERRARLGGLTWSLERNGMWFDNGQHVFMRCCTSYRRFLHRIGAARDVVMQDRLEVPVLSSGGRRDLIRRSMLPVPFHMAGALFGYRQLGTRDKLRAARAAMALRRLDPGDHSLDSETFGDWLRRHRQSDGSIDALWDLIALPTLNLSAAEASLALAVKVFRTGLLEEAGAGDIGWANVPLIDLHAHRAERALDAAGVEVVLGARVTALEGAAPGFSVCTEGRVIGADAVVLSVPPPVASSLAGPGVMGEVERLGRSPIVNVHLVLDRRVTDLPFAAAIGSPVQFLFDRTETSGLSEIDRTRQRQYLAISLSAADAYVGVPSNSLVTLFRDALGDLLPAARSAEVVDALVTREPAATFRAGPGTMTLRPSISTSIEGLFVSGAWCNTGWPATMEGAVQSGIRAAEQALAFTECQRRPREAEMAVVGEASFSYAWNAATPRPEHEPFTQLPEEAMT
jgi:squalene-associated FAD-dependent desaturase